MTEQDVLERERRIQAELAGPGNLTALWELTAEVRRLQGLIKQAEWDTVNGWCVQCPWCGAFWGASVPVPERKHEPTCPAFGSGA